MIPLAATSHTHSPTPTYPCSCAGLTDVYDGPLLPNTGFLQGTSVFQIQDLYVVIVWSKPYCKNAPPIHRPVFARGEGGRASRIMGTALTSAKELRAWQSRCPPPRRKSPKLSQHLRCLHRLSTPPPPTLRPLRPAGGGGAYVTSQHWLCRAEAVLYTRE